MLLAMTRHSLLKTGLWEIHRWVVMTSGASPSEEFSLVESIKGEEVFVHLQERRWLGDYGPEVICCFLSSKVLSKWRRPKQNAAAKWTELSPSSHFSCCPLWFFPKDTTLARKKELAGCLAAQGKRVQDGRRQAPSSNLASDDDLSRNSDEQHSLELQGFIKTSDFTSHHYSGSSSNLHLAGPWDDFQWRVW